jgi:hypothetical protein
VRLLALLSILAAGGAGQVSANGVAVTVPAGWHRIAAVEDARYTDPRTVLVVGTAGVRLRATACQIAAYAVPPHGAVVVIVRWRRGHLPSTSPTHDDRRELARLRTVRRPSFECFRGRGAAAQVALGGHVYQVNVLVGDDAAPRQVGAALAVARSFVLVR